MTRDRVPEAPEGVVRMTAEAAEQAVQRAIDLCARLYEVTQRQDAMIEAGQGDALAELIEQREGLVGEIESAASVVRGMGLETPGVLGAFAPDARSRLVEGLRTLASLGEQISAADSRAERAMLERRDTLSRELQGVKSGGRAVRAYGNVTESPRFKDRAG